MLTSVIWASRFTSPLTFRIENQTLCFLLCLNRLLLQRSAVPFLSIFDLIYVSSFPSVQRLYLSLYNESSVYIYGINSHKLSASLFYNQSISFVRIKSKKYLKHKKKIWEDWEWNQVSSTHSLSYVLWKNPKILLRIVFVWWCCCPISHPSLNL